MGMALNEVCGNTGFEPVESLRSNTSLLNVFVFVIVEQVRCIASFGIEGIVCEPAEGRGVVFAEEKKDGILSHSHMHSGAAPLLTTTPQAAPGIGGSILDQLLPAKQNGPRTFLQIFADLHVCFTSLHCVRGDILL